MSGWPAVRVAELRATPLSVPLIEPFVIATGRIDATRAALVRVTLEDDAGRRATGLGEAAALPPVTREDQPELLAQLAAAAPALAGARLADAAALTAALDLAFPHATVARAGAETAVLDAWARLAGVPLWRLLGGPELAPSLTTDITVPIGTPAHMAELAAAHAERGFHCFKVKIGRDATTDLLALRAVAAAVPGARFRLDANEGFGAADARALLDAALAARLVVECFEQPCARADLAGLAALVAHGAVPIVADESCRGADDLAALTAARAAHGVNLKLAKLGGPLAALAVGRAARAAGLSLMAGAMVETRLGLCAMAHVVTALGGVDWVDLDTAFLLRDEPLRGGWRPVGPELHLTGGPGLDVDVVERSIA